MICKQVKLSRGNTKTVSWVDTEKKIKQGDLIKFKGETEFWKVDKIHNVTLDRKDIHREWNAGGLDPRNRIT